MLELNERDLIVLDEEGRQARHNKDDGGREERESVEVENYEQKEISYDDPVLEEEIIALREEIGRRAEKKALELGATRKDILEGTEIDLESLAGVSLSRGEFELIKDNLDRSVDRAWRSKVTRNKFFPQALPGRVSGADNLSRVDGLLGFAHKHVKALSLFQLANYALALGPAVFKDLAGNKALLEIGDHKISLAEMAKDPRLMEKVSRETNVMAPLDISHLYSHSPVGNPDGADDAEDALNVSVVELKDFKVTQNSGIGEAHGKEKEIMAKYKNGQGEISDADWQKAKQELDDWSAAKGYENFDAAYAAENAPESPTGRFQNLKIEETKIAQSKNFDIFSKTFIKALEKHYTLEEVRKMPPEQVLVVIAEVLKEETDYDFVHAIKKLLAEAVADSPGLVGEYIGEKWNDSMAERNEEGIPYAALKRRESICWESSITYIAAKVVLEKEGIPLGDVACFSTTSLDEIHTWNGLATLSADESADGVKILYSSGDTTLFEHHFWELLKEANFNAVDDWHYYGTDETDQKTLVPVDHVDASGYRYSVGADTGGESLGAKENAQSAHMMTLENIKRHNVLMLQEKIKRDLSEYDPKSHKKDQRIQLNKKAYIEMRKYIAAEKERENNEAKQREAEGLLQKIRNKIWRNKKTE